MVDGYPRQVWVNDAGNELIKSYTIPSMAHGTPLATRAADDQCGAAGPFLSRSRDFVFIPYCALLRSRGRPTFSCDAGSDGREEPSATLCAGAVRRRSAGARLPPARETPSHGHWRGHYQGVENSRPDEGRLNHTGSSRCSPGMTGTVRSRYAERRGELIRLVDLPFLNRSSRISTERESRDSHFRSCSTLRPCAATADQYLTDSIPLAGPSYAPVKLWPEIAPWAPQLRPLLLCPY